jgi:hypothetical protein
MHAAWPRLPDLFLAAMIRQDGARRNRPTPGQKDAVEFAAFRKRRGDC